MCAAVSAANSLAQLPENRVDAKRPANDDERARGRMSSAQRQLAVFSAGHLEGANARVLLLTACSLASSQRERFTLATTSAIVFALSHGALVLAALAASLR